VKKNETFPLGWNSSNNRVEADGTCYQCSPEGAKKKVVPYHFCEISNAKCTFFLKYLFENTKESLRCLICNTVKPAVVKWQCGCVVCLNDCWMDYCKKTLQDGEFCLPAKKAGGSYFGCCCPSLHFQSIVDDRNMYRVLNDDKFTEEYKDKATLAATGEGVRHCPMRGCGATYVEPKQNQKTSLCPACKVEYCNTCKEVVFQENLCKCKPKVTSQQQPQLPHEEIQRQSEPSVVMPVKLSTEPYDGRCYVRYGRNCYQRKYRKKQSVLVFKEDVCSFLQIESSYTLLLYSGDTMQDDLLMEFYEMGDNTSIQLLKYGV